MADLNAVPTPNVEHSNAPAIDWERIIREVLSNTSGVIIEKERQLESLSVVMPDVNDVATQNGMRRQFIAELNLLYAKRRKLSDALNRVATGDFGYCEECGVDIPLARLQHSPESELCVTCLEVREKKEKHFKARRLA